MEAQGTGHGIVLTHVAAEEDGLHNQALIAREAVDDEVLHHEGLPLFIARHQLHFGLDVGGPIPRLQHTCHGLAAR